jgi:predicted metal-dependent HD superfamily phosphohydrolase
MAADFQQSWLRAWRGCGARDDGLDTMRTVLARWSEPHRHYHTRQHLAECLDAFGGARNLPPHPADVEMALWFHDAIHDARRNDNEQLSAEWARLALINAGVGPEVAQRVHDLVLATRHTGGVPVALDAQVLLDIDLAILGAPPPRYAQYEAQVRAEYAHLPIWTFRWKRAEILRGFLQRTRIYNTPYFHDELEAQARENLERSLAQAESRAG